MALFACEKVTDLPLTTATPYKPDASRPAARADPTRGQVIELGGRPVTLSDSSGWVHDSAGIDRAKLEFLRELKGKRRGRLSEYAKAHAGVVYTPARDGAPRVWSAPVEVALPCATQNELTEADAAALVAGGAVAVAEGANMPTTPEAVRLLQ